MHDGEHRRHVTCHTTHLRRPRVLTPEVKAQLEISTVAGRHPCDSHIPRSGKSCAAVRSDLT